MGKGRPSPEYRLAMSINGHQPKLNSVRAQLTRDRMPTEYDGDYNDLAAYDPCYGVYLGRNEDDKPWGLKKIARALIRADYGRKYADRCMKFDPMTGCYRAWAPGKEYESVVCEYSFIGLTEEMRGKLPKIWQDKILYRYEAWFRKEGSLYLSSVRYFFVKGDELRMICPTNFERIVDNARRGITYEAPYKAKRRRRNVTFSALEKEQTDRLNRMMQDGKLITKDA